MSTDIMNELAQIEKNKAYQVLNKVSDHRIQVQIKIAGENKIHNAQLQKIGLRKHFYLREKNTFFDSQPEVTAKIIIDNSLYFLKTKIKKNEQSYYFDDYDNLFELIRRKKPRFSIPAKWAQSASLQGTKTPYDLKSAAHIIEMSKAGMKLEVKAELPNYEKFQNIKLKFKLFRRGEIQINAKIIHVKKNKNGGPTIGLEFIDESGLLKSKIQNICDDLAFYFASEAVT